MDIHKMNKTNKINNYKLTSRFSSLHPLVNIIFYVSVIQSCFIFTNPLFTATIFITMLHLACTYKGTKKTLKTLKIFLITALVIFIITPLTNHRGANILFYINTKPITLEAIIGGFFNMINLLNIVIIFISFNEIIDSERFLYIFSKIAPQSALITDMSLRYISLYKNRAQEIIDVQKIRHSNKSKSITQKIKNAGYLLELLITWCLEEGMSTAIVFKAKNYGVAKRTHYSKYKFTLTDIIATLTLFILTTALILLSINKAGKYNIYYNITITMTTIDLTTYMLMLILLNIPNFVQIRLRH